MKDEKCLYKTKQSVTDIRRSEGWRDNMEIDDDDDDIGRRPAEIPRAVF